MMAKIIDFLTEHYIEATIGSISTVPIVYVMNFIGIDAAKDYVEWYVLTGKVLVITLGVLTASLTFYGKFIKNGKWKEIF